MMREWVKKEWEIARPPVLVVLSIWFIIFCLANIEYCVEEANAANPIVEKWRLGRKETDGEGQQTLSRGS